MAGRGKQRDLDRPKLLAERRLDANSVGRSIRKPVDRVPTLTLSPHLQVGGVASEDQHPGPRER